MKKRREAIDYITNWLKTYADNSKVNGFIIGISGGIDSALTSTLCALTGKKIMAVTLPIRQTKAEFDRANEHIEWLKSRFSNVESTVIHLTDAFEAIEKTLPASCQTHFLAMANTRSRLRMTALYALGQTNGLLVAGTGNKVEDFGVGFFTKYGDGGVDISPIADLYKTDVFALSEELGIVDSIQNAAPTDGLWEDGRSDEDQIGASYPELEWAMEYNGSLADLTARQIEVLRIYNSFHAANNHKMTPIPVCLLPQSLRE
jgi:NAD+ synthase